VGELASLDSFLAAVEQTHTVIDFLQDRLSFSGVTWVRLLLFVGVPVKEVAAFTNWYCCPELRIFRPRELQTRSENRSRRILHSVAIPLGCKFRIVA